MCVGGRRLKVSLGAPPGADSREITKGNRKSGGMWNETAAQSDSTRDAYFTVLESSGELTGDLGLVLPRPSLALRGSAALCGQGNYFWVN